MFVAGTGGISGMFSSDADHKKSKKASFDKMIAAWPELIELNPNGRAARDFKPGVRGSWKWYSFIQGTGGLHRAKAAQQEQAELQDALQLGSQPHSPNLKPPSVPASWDPKFANCQQNSPRGLLQTPRCECCARLEHENRMLRITNESLLDLLMKRERAV